MLPSPFSPQQSPAVEPTSRLSVENGKVAPRLEIFELVVEAFAF